MFGIHVCDDTSSLEDPQLYGYCESSGHLTYNSQMLVCLESRQFENRPAIGIQERAVGQLILSHPIESQQ
jgi:hypothetical protein